MKKYLFQSRVVSPCGVVSLVLCAKKTKLVAYLSEERFSNFKTGDIVKSKFWQSIPNDDIIIKVC